MVSVYVMIFELQLVFLKESESLGLESVVPPSGFGKGGRGGGVVIPHSHYFFTLTSYPPLALHCFPESRFLFPKIS